MLKLDVSDMMAQTGLQSSANDVWSLLYALSVQSTNYVANIENLRDGVRPSEGHLIASNAASDQIVSCIKGQIVLEQYGCETNLNVVYTDTIYQFLIASGIIPVGWIHTHKEKTVDTEMTSVKGTWDHIVQDSVYSGLYLKMKAFGMVIRTVVGHDTPDLLYFVIPNNSIEKAAIENYIQKEHVYNMIVLDESEYTTKLVDTNYNFLFKFDRLVGATDGVVFRGTTNLVQLVPSYLVSIGCDERCVFLEKNDSQNYAVTGKRFKSVEIKKGEVLETVVSIPANYAISYITINGISHFIDSEDATANGIYVTALDDGVISGYKAYQISIYRIDSSSKILISACQDLTDAAVNYTVISRTRSAMEVRDEDIVINLTFNDPFLYLDTNKIKVYGNKDDSSEKELIEGVSFLMDGYTYHDRKMVFGAEAIHRPVDRIDMSPKESPLYQYDHRPNPYVRDSHRPGLLPYPSRRPTNIPREGRPESDVILYSIAEAGSVVLTIPGYTDYKYITVSFDDRAMISSRKIPGKLESVEVIPKVEWITFINDEIESSTEENPSEDTDKNTEDNGENTSEPVSNGEQTETPANGEVSETETNAGGIPETDDSPKSEENPNENTTENTETKEDDSEKEGNESMDGD